MIIVAGILAHVASTGSMSVLIRSLLNSLHAPGFAAMTVVVVWLFRSGTHARHPYLLATGFCLSLAVIAEASQVVTARDADLADLGTDILGISAGLLATSLYFDDFVGRDKNVWLRRIALALATVLCSAVVFPALDIIYTISAQHSASPRLATFESRWEQRLYAGSLESGMSIVPSPHEGFGPGRRTALLDIDTPRIAGLELIPFADWSGFQYFSFTVASATEKSQTATLRVFDSMHNSEYEDRFNLLFDAPVEPTTIRIPLAEIESAPASRKIDLRHIQAVIFLSTTGGERKIYVDNIRLE